MPKPSPRCAETNASQDLYSSINSRFELKSLTYSIGAPGPRALSVRRIVESPDEAP